MADPELTVPELIRADLPVLEDPYCHADTGAVVEDVMLGPTRTKPLMRPAEVVNRFVFGYASHAAHLDGADLLFAGGYTHTYV